jgi:hypothetical protein
MTTVDDRMPTKDLEVEVREPAWSTKVRLGPQEPQVLWSAMSVTAVRRMGALGAHRWVSRAAGAHFIRRVGTSAIRSLSDEKRT